MTQQPVPDELLLIGYVTMPHGIRGQLKLHAVTNRPENLHQVKTVYVGDDRTPYKLRRIIEHKPTVLIITLSGVDTREAAEALKGREVYMREQDALPLEADEYYLHDLPGLRVETHNGIAIGTVKEIIETGANEVLVVGRSEGGEVLIPMIKDVVKQLDVAAGVIVIDPIPGLLE